MALTEAAIADIYSYYGSDMGITDDEFKAEVTGWKHKWSGMGLNVTPQTLVETLDHANPQFYPGVYVALVTLLTAERSFSSMKRLKTPLRSTMKTKD